VGVSVCIQCAAPLANLCPHCGFENPSGFKFCGNCGANLLAATLTRTSDEETLKRLQSYIPPTLVEKILRAGKEMEGERRNVTILFSDVSGFTTMSEKLDPEEIYTLIDNTLKAFLQVIYQHEGTLDKFMGDGLMALFGAPVSHEDDPVRAVRAALGMQAALKPISEDLEARLGLTLKVRIGLNSGLVVVGSLGSDLRMDYTALGDTVNVASRLQGVAEPGTILVSRPVYDQTKALFDFHELGTIRVKGRGEPVEIFEVVGPRREPARLRGISGMAAPMVGREAEFSQLKRVVDDLVNERRGRVVLVTGEAGMGKSRLTAEVKGYLAARDVTLLEGACLSYGQSAYAIFLQILRGYFQIGEEDNEDVARDKIEQSVRRVIGQARSLVEVLPYLENLLSVRVVEKELAERIRHLDPSQLRQQTLLAVRDFLMALARQRPLVLVFEDLHWVDKLSLDLLLFSLNSVEQVPILFYCISRSTGGPAESQLERLGATILAAHYLPIPLTKLSLADSLTLVDLLLTIADLPESLKQMIPQRAEGNPFYLEEIIRMLIDRGIIRRSNSHWAMAPDADLTSFQVPSTLQGLIMTRVDHLREGPHYTIQCASVIGRNFPLRLLTRVTDDAPQNTLAHVQELEDHELVNRTLEIPELEYAFRHILVQETVYNSLLVRRRERLHQKIAETIEALYADRLADYTKSLAYHFTESKDAAKALHYSIQAGQRAAARFANDAALAYFRQAAETLNKTAPTLEQRLEVFRGLGDVQVFVGEYDGALNSFHSALEVLRTTADRPQTEAEIEDKIGRVFERKGDYAQALRWLEAALSDLDRDPRNAQAVERARVYNDIGWVQYRRGQFEEAFHWGMRCLQIVEGTDYYNEMASAYNRLVALFYQKGDWTRALAYAEKGLHLRETIGDTYGMVASYNNLGLVAAGQGQIVQSIHYFDASLETSKRIGSVEGMANSHNNLGLAYIARGEYDSAETHIRRGLEIAEKVKSATMLALTYNNLGHVLWIKGDSAGALTALQRALQVANEIGSKEDLAETHALLAEVYLAQERIPEAVAAAERALALSAEIGSRLHEGTAYRVSGRIAMARGNRAAAETQLQHSLAIFNELKNVYEAAKSQYRLALLAESQQPEQARALAESARATFERIGAEADRRAVEDWIARLGALPLPETGH
jgi:class 3 adenylate cyclase/tetratricopeptide (TPR) repeat protein